jgi:hypothetical protein
MQISPFLWSLEGRVNMIFGQPAGDKPISRLALVVNEPNVARFVLMFQKGMRIRSRVGCSVDAFLREELGAGPAMIEKIQSIMLDGKPVDDIGAAVVHDGSVIALSAAMPGLVGATLRRGGAYSSFRSAITYHENGMACAPGVGWVSIKLFNLLMAELGPGLLRHGVLINAADLTDFFAEQSPEFRRGCSAALDNRAIDVDILRESGTLTANDPILLTVVAAGTRPDGRR